MFKSAMNSIDDVDSKVQIIDDNKPKTTKDFMSESGTLKMKKGTVDE